MSTTPSHFKGKDVARAMGARLANHWRQVRPAHWSRSAVYMRVLSEGQPAPVRQDEPGQPGELRYWVWDVTAQALTAAAAPLAPATADRWLLVANAWSAGKHYQYTLWLVAPSFVAPAMDDNAPLAGW